MSLASSRRWTRSAWSDPDARDCPERDEGRREARSGQSRARVSPTRPEPGARWVILPTVAGVPGWPVAFRGSRAVTAGLVTRDRLRGPRFQRLLPDVYGRACPEAPTLLLRSLAAYRLVEGHGVLSGYSAATLLDAACAPRADVPAEVTVVGGGLRGRHGLVVHRDTLRRDEITRAGDVLCT